MTTNGHKINVETGKKGFQETEKAAPTTDANLCEFAANFGPSVTEEMSLAAKRLGATYRIKDGYLDIGNRPDTDLYYVAAFHAKVDTEDDYESRPNAADALSETPSQDAMKQMDENYEMRNLRNGKFSQTEASPFADSDTQSRLHTATSVLAARFPDVESISFRVEEDWDDTIFDDEGEEWAVLRATVIDVITKDGEEIAGDEYDDSENISGILDSELTQSVLRDVYDNDASVPLRF